MTERLDITASVRAILLAIWDPIGIRAMPKAQDEYDDYVPDLVRLLHEGVDADTLAEHLLRIEAEEMGLSPDAGRANRVALKLQQRAA